MNLIIDQGNTRAKLGVFKENDLERIHSVTNSKAFNWDAIDLNAIDRMLIASVSDSIFKIPKVYRGAALFYSNKLNLPITVDYKTPETLGSDRIANAVAASFLFPETNVLIIDAGTCLKFDLITRDGTYRGGSISPGLRMRTNALHSMTGKLPAIDPDPTIVKIPGKSTFESLNVGVVTGMAHEINSFCEQYSSEYDDLQIVATGGDIDFFAEAIKSPIFAHDFLTLLGLNLILQNN